jgi:hypothetical protein
VDNIYFRIRIPATPQNGPSGYLFLCPAKYFQTGPSSFRWPDCPAYWSVDPEGVQRLSPEETAGLGFPTIQMNLTATGDSWDANVYTGLRQFHQAKGFDPDSQDVARYLGHRIFQLPAEIDPPFAHGKYTVPPQLPFVPHNDEQWILGWKKNTINPKRRRVS